MLSIEEAFGFGRASVRWRVWAETQRTPWPIAGCNKPAAVIAEKTVEVVRNHESGTCSTVGAVEPKGTRTSVLVSGSGRRDRTRRRGTPRNESHERSQSSSEGRQRKERRSEGEMKAMKAVYG